MHSISCVAADKVSTKLAELGIDYYQDSLESAKYN